MNQQGEIVASSARPRSATAPTSRASAASSWGRRRGRWTDDELRDVEKQKFEYYQSFLDLKHDRRLFVKQGDEAAAPADRPAHADELHHRVARVSDDGLGRVPGLRAARPRLWNAGWLPEMSRDREGAKIDPTLARRPLPRALARPRAGALRAADRAAARLRLRRDDGRLDPRLPRATGAASGARSSTARCRTARPRFTGDVTFLDGEVERIERGPPHRPAAREREGGDDEPARGGDGERHGRGAAPDGDAAGALTEPGPARRDLERAALRRPPPPARPVALHAAALPRRRGRALRPAHGAALRGRRHQLRRAPQRGAPRGGGPGGARRRQGHARGRAVREPARVADRELRRRADRRGGGAGQHLRDARRARLRPAPLGCRVAAAAGAATAARLPRRPRRAPSGARGPPGRARFAARLCRSCAAPLPSARSARTARSSPGPRSARPATSPRGSSTRSRRRSTPPTMRS